MELGESSSTSSPPRSGPPAPPTSTVGDLEVTVKHRSVCWDSTPDGSPAVHPRANVIVHPAGGGTQTKTTGDDGIARFEGLHVGEFTVDASDTGYTSATERGTITPSGTASVTIQIELDTGGAIICNRQHTPDPAGVPTIDSLPLVFWHDAFMIWIRETAWLVFLVAMLVTGVLAALNVGLQWHADPGLALSLPTLCFGVVGFLTTIIFGLVPGVITMVLAGLAWLALLALTIAFAVGPAYRFLPLDFLWFPPLCGMWVAFFVMLVPRLSYQVETDIGYVFLFPIPAVVVAEVVFFVLVLVPSPPLLRDPGGIAAYACLCLVLAYVFGLLGGLAGHVFRNDGDVVPYTAHPTRMALPYAGERYCVQGNRGWFSHYLSTQQERCYDFAVPLGTRVLAIQAGHVIEFRDDRDGSAFDRSRNRQANFIRVQHRDGSVAQYLHLRKHGIRDVNQVLVDNSTTLTGDVYRSDVHVHAGQVLAEAGSTGISRFPHIHLGLYDSRGGALGLEFADADVQRHGGRCFTFRKYLSSNPDKGPINV